MKNKASGGSQTCAVEGAYAPRTSRQERRGVLELSICDTFIWKDVSAASVVHNWYNVPSHYEIDPNTLTLINMGNGDWYNDKAPSGNNIADQNDPEHTKLVYIWYGSGYGIGNVNFNTQGMPWSYYLDNNIPLPTSTQ